MLISYRWIKELTGVDESAEAIANRLTFSGLEVEGVETVGDLSSQIVVARIETKEAHPESEKLSVVTVNSGSEVHQVVCGAPNCPGPGGKVVMACPGATVGEIQIASRKVAGVESAGMLVSEAELGIGPEDDGIIILNDVDAPIGTSVRDALDLEDWIIDVAITPNRPDAISHRGIAREVCLLCGVPFSPPKAPGHEVGGKPVASLATVTVEDVDLCPRYAATVVTDVRWAPSPFALRYRLHNLGLRPISNLVDATNLIMLEYGQPIHAFDLDTLAENAIIVRRARAGEKMVTLDGVERVFDTSDLLICDANEPVAIAGVMGGETTGVSEKTKRVLIECAYFNPSTVRRTSKRLKLSTDAAYRFERGMDPGNVVDVINAATAKLSSMSGGTPAPSLIDCYPSPISAPKLTLRPSRYEQVIGCRVPLDEMNRIVIGIGAETRVVDGAIEVIPPTSRPDIEREIDLIEEVVRIRGFAEVPMTAPRTTCLRPNRAYFQAERRAKEILSTLGLQEAISYSFVPREYLSLIGADDNIVDIANPLNAERSAMRTSLLAGLLENLKRAQSRFLSRFAQFEVARTYHATTDPLPNEVLRAAAIMSGPADTWIGETERNVDFYDIKGVFESFVDSYHGGKGIRFEPLTDHVAFHPRRAVSILSEGHILGHMGEMHPNVLSRLKLHRGVVAFELQVYPLWQNRTLPDAVPLPEFPPMSRDVALLVPLEMEAGSILAAFESQIGPLAENVAVFDVYTGDKIPEGKKSLAFSVVYRAMDRTLTDKEVDRLHQKAVNAVSRQFGAQQR